MRKSIHRYVLPSCYVTIHILLLLPLVLPYRIDPSEPELPLGSRVNFKLSIPLGILLFVILALVRPLAGYFPLPRGQERRLLATVLEWIVLFLVGFTEELIRWAVVKVLVNLEGGEGGFGGEGASNSTRPAIDWMQLRSVEVKPGIWEGVYLMGWTWSLLECLPAWWYLSPISTTALPDDSFAIHNTEHGSRRQQKRRSADAQSLPSRINRPSNDQDPEQGYFKRFSATTATTVIGFFVDHPTSTEDTPLLADNSTIVPTYIVERSSSPELTRRPREQDEDAGDEETSTDCRDSNNDIVSYFQKGAPSQIKIPSADDDSDEDTPTPTQSISRSQMFTRRLSLNNTLLDDDRRAQERIKQKRRISSYHPSGPRRSPGVLESSSDSDAGPSIPWRHTPNRSISATPRLSTSIPAEQGRTIHDITRRPSTQPLPLPPNEAQAQSPGTNRPPLETRSASLVSMATADEADYEDELGAEASTSAPRLNPSLQNYSSSYTNNHFPPSPTPSKTRSLTSKRLLSRTNSKASGTPTGSTSTIRRTRSTKKDRASYHEHRRQTSSVTTVELPPPANAISHINGIDIDGIPLSLAIMWRAITAFKHTGHGLWYAWLPSVFFAGQFQWWSFGAVVALGGLRGYLTAEWDSGRITARELHWPVTSITFLWSFLLYLIILILWGAFW